MRRINSIEDLNFVEIKEKKEDDKTKIKRAKMITNEYLLDIFNGCLPNFEMERNKFISDIIIHQPLQRSKLINYKETLKFEENKLNEEIKNSKNVDNLLVNIPVTKSTEPNSPQPNNTKLKSAEITSSITNSLQFNSMKLNTPVTNNPNLTSQKTISSMLPNSTTLTSPVPSIRKLTSPVPDNTKLTSPLANSPISNSPGPSSPVYEKYFLVLPNKEDNFIEDYVHEINKARLNCKKYIRKIDKLILKIKIDKNTKEQYFMFNEKVYINSGISELIECKKYLENIKDEKIFFKVIQNVEELKMPFPEDIEKWNDDDYIKKSMRKFEKKVKGKYKLKEFFYKKFEINDGEVSGFLTILNHNHDNKSDIRKAIFNEKTRYIGINYKKIDEKCSIIYVNFAK